MTLTGIRYIDLFSGIGGFHSALSSFGAACVFASDTDKDCQDIYEKNYGIRPKGDITQIHAAEIPDHDILCAGFPCQAFSISGKQLGFADDRGTLFFDIIRIAEHHKPKVLLLENVKNLQSHAKGKTLDTICRTLKGLGYSVHWKLLNASHFGVPQKRERIYILALRADVSPSLFTFPKGYGNPTTLADILLDKGTEGYNITRDDIFFKERETADHKLFAVSLQKPIRIGTVNKGGQGERIYSIHGHAITLSAYGGGIGAKTGLYLVGDVVRRLTPRECARLMGFPDTFILHEKKNIAYKQFGNSLVVPVVKAIVERIIQTGCLESVIKINSSLRAWNEKNKHEENVLFAAES
jgi:DNA (cytosine-5)-methyltransferase 1